MEKRIRVAYTEQSKAVVTSTSLEYIDSTGEKIKNEETIKEAYELFQQAQQHAGQANWKKAQEKLR